jgi:hypothetical protein
MARVIEKYRLLQVLVPDDFSGVYARRFFWCLCQTIFLVFMPDDFSGACNSRIILDSKF